jgi:hypothetical protein
VLRGLLGLLVMLLATEATLRVVLLIDPIATPLTRSTPWNGSARLFWTDHRLKSLLSGQHVGWDRVSGEAAWDPELGWTRLPGDPETDEHGCRDANLPRAPGATRVVLVGDSYTYGEEVLVGDTYGHLLEERRADVDVHNLGVAAYDHLQAALRWERDGAPLRPAAVVLLGIGVDAPRSLFWFYGYAKPWPEIGPDGAARVLGQPVDAPPTTFVKGLAHPRLLDLVEVVRERREAVREEAARLAEAARRSRAVLDRWAASVSAAGALPVLLAVPTPQELDDLRRDPTVDSVVRSRELYRGWCEGRSFPCEDVWDELIAGADPAGYRAGVHFSHATNARIAAIVEDRLVRAGVLPALPVIGGEPR